MLWFYRWNKIIKKSRSILYCFVIVKCIRMIVKRIERDIAREGIILLSLGVYGVISTGKNMLRTDFEGK